MEGLGDAADGVTQSLDRLNQTLNVPTGVLVNLERFIAAQREGTSGIPARVATPTPIYTEMGLARERIGEDRLGLARTYSSRQATVNRIQTGMASRSSIFNHNTGEAGS